MEVEPSGRLVQLWAGVVKDVRHALAGHAAQRVVRLLLLLLPRGGALGGAGWGAGDDRGAVERRVHVVAAREPRVQSAPRVHHQPVCRPPSWNFLAIGTACNQHRGLGK